MVTRKAGARTGLWASTRTAGQTSGAPAYESATRRLVDRGLRLRRVMEDVGEPRIEEELSCREALDEAHGAATAGTRPR
jgi:hypothetical protein